MLSSGIVKFIELLPEPMVIRFAKAKVRKYIKKYAAIKSQGIENIEQVSGPKIFICNHLSNSDGLVLDEVLKKYEPTFVAGVKLKDDPVTSLGTKVVKNIAIKPNSVDKEAIIKMVQILKNGENLMIFPEGTRSRTSKMIEGKKGILLVARMSKAKIVPISMWGTEKLLPINKEENMAKEKWNTAEVNIKVGKNVDLPAKEKDESKHDYDHRCMEIIMKSIARNLPKEYRGIYE